MSASTKTTAINDIWGSFHTKIRPLILSGNFEEAMKMLTPKKGKLSETVMLTIYTLMKHIKLKDLQSIYDPSIPALRYAVSAQNWEIALWLIQDAKEDVTKYPFLTVDVLYSYTTNNSPLSTKDKKRYLVIEALLQAGASPNTISSSNGTPLIVAIAQADYLAIKLLRKYGADYSIQVGRKNALLSLSAKIGDIALTPEYRNFERRSHFWKHRFHILKDILASDAINAINTIPNTYRYAPIHYIASTKDQFKFAKMLINAGANPSLATRPRNPNEDPMNAMEVATSNGHTDMAKFMEHQMKRLEADQAREHISLAESIMELSPSKQLPFDLVMKIVTATAKMSPTQSRNYERKNYYDSRLSRKSKKTNSSTHIQEI